MTQIEKKEFLKISGQRPTSFSGAVRLPPSKSYLHRALFVSSLCSTTSSIENVGSSSFSDDVNASISALRSFGVEIWKARRDSNSLRVRSKVLSSSRSSIFAGGSGTTARFGIAFAAIPNDGGRSIISGDASLLKRPMQPLIDALGQVGVRCYSRNSDGKLPVIVESNGIEGGNCRIDGSISSQFISALLIACTQARKDTIIEIENPSRLVSVPYIEATQYVLKYYGFKIKKIERSSDSSLRFQVKRNQIRVSGRKFQVPGDMSSAAVLIGATLAAKGRIKLIGVNPDMPQADFVFLNIASKLGASISQRGRSLIVSAGKDNASYKEGKALTLDLKDSPDSVPVVSGLAAALGRDVKIRNVGHLRFKESDRLRTLSRELSKIGMKVSENKESLTVSSPRTDLLASSRHDNSPLTLSSEKDHRILMALVVAGISGRFGELLISDPSCVSKSYPSFISDLKFLAHEEKHLLSIVRRK
jgi:3-phosphoshikimate 1-carboxyvinyltransferase